ncbi:MAG: hypothetical protein FJY75_07630 [Candidatus Eisenbacteria bacterium]|uniref:FlgD/Vpr Ig-like domain-containing protein n=1 Tax=Eiseniibacteriota bacterium TaxID=2212470 RepID=A0A937X886_UNCEI|nr:hypothetical protein [Candidatus Eisenbacteria bacterium]
MGRAIRSRMRWLVFLGLAVPAALAILPGAAAPDIRVSLQPDPACADQGEQFRLFVYVDSAGSEFNGYETVIRFNPNRLLALSAQEESVMVDVCGNTWWRRRIGADSVFISHVALCGALTATGPGALSSITFRALQGPAVTPVVFDYIEFYDAGEIVPSVSHDGVVVITPDCPPSGACCLGDGSCTEVDEPDCAALGGEFQGYFVPCTPDLCPRAGVCCVGETCLLALAGECADLGGEWYEEWSACDPNPCEFSPVGEAPAARVPARLECVPNPTTGSVRLRYDLAGAAYPRIEIFDAAGRLVRSLAGRAGPAARGTIQWDGRDSGGRRVPPGVYQGRLTAGDETVAGQVILIE